MPGMDGTGPQGVGPMTGGGRGQCVTDVPRAGLGHGLGRGPGRGFRRAGRGLGRGIGFGRKAQQ